MYSYAHAKYSDVQKNRANALLGEALKQQNQLYPAKEDAIVIDNVLSDVITVRQNYAFVFKWVILIFPLTFVAPLVGFTYLG